MSTRVTCHGCAANTPKSLALWVPLGRGWGSASSWSANTVIVDGFTHSVLVEGNVWAVIGRSIGEVMKTGPRMPDAFRNPTVLSYQSPVVDGSVLWQLCDVAHEFCSVECREAFLVTERLLESS